MIIQLMRRIAVGRPISWVKPRIPIPDSTTPANPWEGLTTRVANEVTVVNLETVTSSDSEGPEDGW